MRLLVLHGVADGFVAG